MVDPRDRRPQGDPDTVVYVPTGALVGLYIKGVRGQVMLAIREDRDGHPLKCAITNELYVEYPPAHSNPRRRSDHGRNE